MRIDNSLRAWLRRLRNMLVLLGPVQTGRFFVHKLLKRPVVRLRVGGLERPVTCRPADSDIRCLWQVFGLRDCHCELPDPPRLIIDGGANVGYSTLYYARMYPNATILAIEPDERNLAVLRENCAHLPQVRLVQAAIWDRSTWLRIENPEDESWRFRVAEVAAPGKDTFRGESMEVLISQSGFERADLVKLDIEGAESKVFAAEDLEWLDHVAALVVEIHGSHAQAIVGQAMRNRGFRSFSQGEKLLFFRETFGSQDSPAGGRCAVQ